MQNEILNLESVNIDNSQIENNEYMVGILENPHVNFNEVLDIAKQIQSMKKTIPTTAEIINNFEKDTRHEEQKIN